MSASARERVLESEEMLGEIFGQLGLGTRLRWRTVSRLLKTVFEDAAHWKALRLRKVLVNSSPSWQLDLRQPLCFPLHKLLASVPLSLSSLDIHGCLAAPNAGPLVWPPALVELDVSWAAMELGTLRAALEACGPTLLRLNLSAVRIQTKLGGSQKAIRIGLITQALRHESARKGFTFADMLDRWISLLRPLERLQVLVARDADTHCLGEDDQLMLGESWLSNALRDGCCPQLLELSLGWSSEFEDKAGGPGADVEFNEALIVALPCKPSSVPPTLRALCLAGYVGMQDVLLEMMLGTRGVAGATAAVPLHTLDVCGCRGLGDTALARSLGAIAPSLRHLNVRATGFGDEAALALAAGGVRLVRLNASCTQLTPRGLAALSEATPAGEMRMLDLCYAQGLRTADALAVARRHRSLEMVGLGGFVDLGRAALVELLERCTPSLRHLGIGGCTGLDGGDALRLLAEQLPGLTALNAHRLRDLGAADVAFLLGRCTSLRSLDISGSGILELPAEVVTAVPSCDAAKWEALGSCRVGEHFTAGEVITAAAPVQLVDHVRDVDARVF